MTPKEKELIKTIREHSDPKRALETAIKIITEMLFKRKPVHVAVSV